MAPIQSRKGQGQTKADASDDENLPDSQQTSLDMLITAREMVEANKKRRNRKRKTMEEEQGKRVKTVTAKINILFEARKARVTKTQKEQWARLDDLNNRRSAIEAQILSSMKSIEQHTLNVISEMSAMLDGRVDELKETELDGTTVHS